MSYASAWELGRLLALSSPAFVKGCGCLLKGDRTLTSLRRRSKNFSRLHRSSFKDPAISTTRRWSKVKITEDLVEWIARLVLLYPVPFHYLVPHQSLLPSESLRFFHLDDNWVDALVDGAFSIAVRISRRAKGVAS